MRRRVLENKVELIPHIKRITSSTNLIVRNDWKSIDLFIIGGGGSGGGWRDWGWGPGGGGSGGECVTIKGIEVIPGMKIKISVGKGGSGVSCASHEDGNPGEQTTVTFDNGDTYEARGGNPGLKCIQSNQWNTFISPNAAGYDWRNDAIGVEYDGDIMDVYNRHGNILVEKVDWNNYPYTSPYILNMGIPEFHEDGNPTHAGGGSGNSNTKSATSFNENSGGDFDNIAEGFLFHGGGGFGGGGAGAYYRSGYSGSGGNGGIVIRYYAVG